MAEKVALDINVPYNHISIKVKDLETSLEFYRDLLGLPVERRLEDPEIVWLPGLELSPLEEGETFAFDGHIGLGVRNIEEVCAYLEEQGVEFDVPLKDVVWEEMGKGLKLAFFNDPDGLSVELVQWRDL